MLCFDSVGWIAARRGSPQPGFGQDRVRQTPALRTSLGRCSSPSGVPASSPRWRGQHQNTSAHNHYGRVVSDCGRTCSDAARASAGWSEAWSIYPPWAGRVRPGPGRRAGGPLTANFRGTRVGKKGERLSENQATRLNSSVEWRGGKAGNCCCGAFPLLPIIASRTGGSAFATFGSRTHAPHAQATFFFFRRTPTAEQATCLAGLRVPSAAIRSCKKIFNSRELFTHCAGWIAARSGHPHRPESRSDKCRPVVPHF